MYPYPNCKKKIGKFWVNWFDFGNNPFDRKNIDTKSIVPILKPNETGEIYISKNKIPSWGFYFKDLFVF